MIRIVPVVFIGILFTLVSTLPLEDLSNGGDMKDVKKSEKCVETDMILTEAQDRLRFIATRNGLISTKYRWPNKTLPYELGSGFTKEQEEMIEEALGTIESESCVQIVKRTNEKDYVRVETGVDVGCNSCVGRQGGMQLLHLEVDCFTLGIITHEFLHAFGFYHMHGTYDRDKYVKIVSENVETSMKDEFEKHPSSEITYFNTTYDYNSVMHYDPWAFSKNGKPTIVPLDKKFFDVIGKIQKMSENDVYRLNAMYKCDNS